MAQLCTGGHFAEMVCVHLSLRGKLHCKSLQILTDNLHPVMKCSYPDGSALFQDHDIPINTARGLVEWFDEHENEGNHIQSPPKVLKQQGQVNCFCCTLKTFGFDVKK